MKREKMVPNLNPSQHKNIQYKSLQELVTALSEEKRSSFHDIIHSTKIPPSAFEHCYSWSPESYTRNCIVENEKFELILLCWEPGQQTPIHDHGGEECWVQVIQGEFKETIYNLDEAGELTKVKSTSSKAGDISYMIDFMGYHRLENSSEKRAISLHLYAKPIRTCEIYDENTGEFVQKDLEYCTMTELIEN